MTTTWETICALVRPLNQHLMRRIDAPEAVTPEKQEDLDVVTALRNTILAYAQRHDVVSNRACWH